MTHQSARPVRPQEGRAGRRLSRWVARAMATGVLVVLVALLALATMPRVLGYRTLTVQSASMTGTASVGSLVVARPLSADEVEVGDVVLVRAETDGVAAAPVLHRVIELHRRGGQVVVRTKGDANATPDPNPYVLAGDTMTPVLVVPHAGRWLAFARTPLGWTAIVAIPATLLLWFQMKAIWFPRRPPEPDPAARPVPDHALA